MNIKIQSEILHELKEELIKEGKTAVRFEMVDFGWNGPIFDIKFDDKKEEDILEEVEGVKFVIESELEKGLVNPEIIKNGSKFVIKRNSCGC